MRAISLRSFTRQLQRHKFSLFVEQNHTQCAFADGESWVVLTPIEQSIKRKIEALGTPLKEWDIQINYGIKTGYNPAFIISTAKRDEILSKCQSADERHRTEELIRPILRGRDIKRYGYEWAELWLINTHNGVKGRLPRIEIEDYPAVKAHLDEYWENLAKRADQGDTPYNLRNCAYMEDFQKPKIIYPNMTKFMPFTLDLNGYMTNQKCFIVTGMHIGFLTAFFNSSLFKFCFRETFPMLQAGTREMSKIFFDKIPVKRITEAENMKFSELVTDIQANYTKEKATHLDSLLFDMYGLTQEERASIGFIEIQ